jgi:SAM-dependent methyltransferase
MDEFWDTRDSVLPPDFQELLQNYSQISPEDQIEHIKKIRTKAWKVKQYPCIGSYMFLDLSMKDHSAYAEVLASLRSSKDATLLDLGCCIGQDLRKLAFDGVPGDQLVGYDIEPGFFQVGYEAFQDKRHFQAGFVAGDFLASKGETSEEHRQDQYRFVHAAYFFHLWSWKKQVEASSVQPIEKTTQIANWKLVDGLGLYESCTPPAR